MSCWRSRSAGWASTPGWSSSSPTSRRFMKPDVVLLPSRIDLLVAPVERPRCSSSSGSGGTSWPGSTTRRPGPGGKHRISDETRLGRYWENRSGRRPFSWAGRAHTIRLEATIRAARPGRSMASAGGSRRSSRRVSCDQLAVLVRADRAGTSIFRSTHRSRSTRGTSSASRCGSGRLRRSSPGQTRSGRARPRHVNRTGFVGGLFP